MIIFSAPSRGQQVLTPLGVEQTTSLLVVLISSDFLQRKSGSPAVIGGPPGALRPKVASEPPTPRVRTTVMPLIWLAGFELSNNGPDILFKYFWTCPGLHTHAFVGWL